MPDANFEANQEFIEYITKKGNHIRTVEDSNWRSLESAPKDGTDILVAKEGYMCCVSWQGKMLGWGCSAHGDTCGMYDFEAWMPLPKPPNE